MFPRMLRDLALAVCAFAAAAGGAAARSDSVAFEWKRVLGVPVNVVTVNLNDEEVRVTAAVARGGIGTSEKFKSLINRVHPAAAITGSFFDTRSLRPIGDIAVDGQTLSKGAIGTGVAFTPTNEVDFVPLRNGSKTDWTPYASVMCAGPWLVKDGMRWVYPRAEGYRDPSLFSRRPRAAIGFTSRNKMLLVTIERPVYYSEVSKIMRALGAVNALGLDGGSSTALSCRGKIISKPSRKLTNVLLVYDGPYHYERAIALHRLFPRRSRTARPAPPAAGVPATDEPIPLDAIMELEPTG